MSTFRRSVLAAISAAAVACSPLPAEPAPAPSPTVDARLSAIREARALVADPAVELRAAVQRLVARVGAMRTELATADAAARADDLLAEPIGDVEGAVAALRAVELPPGPDTARADDALTSAIAAAEGAIAAARGERDEVLALASFDEELLALTEAWDEPGSRRQQLERFAALADAADGLRGRAEAGAPLHTCSRAWVRRAVAAEHVATATRELREYVSSYQGRAFDERRLELAADPLGVGVEPLGEADARELTSCWSDGSEVARAAAALDEALADLEAALNPSDVATAPDD